MATGDRSFSDVVQDIVGNIQEIVRSEVRLAKTEVRAEAAKAKSAAVLAATGVLCGIFAAFFLLLAIVYALTRLIPDWAAALAVGMAVAIVGGMTLSAGTKRFKQVHPMPDKTVESVKENVEWVKQQTK